MIKNKDSDSKSHFKQKHLNQLDGDLNINTEINESYLSNDKLDLEINISNYNTGNSENIKYNRDSNKKGKTITKTFIYLPHPDFFFDILTWIYSNDSDRLALAADEPESFLSILNLGIFLEMNEMFFKILLEKCEIKISEKLLNHHLWSRFSFTFDVLQNLLKLIPEHDHFLKINACLSWLNT